jgi:hypothetical protein
MPMDLSSIRQVFEIFTHKKKYLKINIYIPPENILFLKKFLYKKGEKNLFPPIGYPGRVDSFFFLFFIFLQQPYALLVLVLLRYEVLDDLDL